MRTIGLTCGLAVLELFFSIPAAAALVTNGGFETGDFTGWTLNGTNAGVGTFHHSGLYSAWFQNPTGLTYLSQMIPTTAGQSYLLSLYYANYMRNPNGTPNDYVELWWNGTYMGSDTNDAAFSWQEAEVLVTATGASTELKFGFRNATGNWSLDDVSVDSVPEPATALPVLGCIGLLLAARRQASRKQRR